MLLINEQTMNRPLRRISDIPRLQIIVMTNLRFHGIKEADQITGSFLPAAENDKTKTYERGGKLQNLLRQRRSEKDK